MYHLRVAHPQGFLKMVFCAWLSESVSEITAAKDFDIAESRTTGTSVSGSLS